MTGIVVVWDATLSERMLHIVIFLNFERGVLHIVIHSAPCTPLYQCSPYLLLCSLCSPTVCTLLHFFLKTFYLCYFRPAFDRVSSCVAELTKLDLDSRSTAAYGICHILCALTVTNRELRMAALADKGVTMEQFEQLQELQRIKTKDEDGNPIEEKKVSNKANGL